MKNSWIYLERVGVVSLCVIVVGILYLSWDWGFSSALLRLKPLQVNWNFFICGFADCLVKVLLSCVFRTEKVCSVEKLLILRIEWILKENLNLVKESVILLLIWLLKLLLFYLQKLLQSLIFNVILEKGFRIFILICVIFSICIRLLESSWFIGFLLVLSLDPIDFLLILFI